MKDCDVGRMEVDRSSGAAACDGDKLTEDGVGKAGGLLDPIEGARSWGELEMERVATDDKELEQVVVGATVA